MLRSIEEILGYQLETPDGKIGRLKDIYFDDSSWAVRYVVVDTGGWLSSRQVLLAPEVLGEPDLENRKIPVFLTRQRIEDSPVIMQERGISWRQQELLAEYYEWSGPENRSDRSRPPGAPGSRGGATRVLLQSAATEQDDPHLKSLRALIGYHIRARGVDIGHIEDMLVQTDSWLLRYMVVDARNLLPGKKVLVSPAWVQGIDWRSAFVDVDLNPGSIKDGPAFDPSQTVSRDYERKLYDHYGGDRYWE